MKIFHCFTFVRQTRTRPRNVHIYQWKNEKGKKTKKKKKNETEWIYDFKCICICMTTSFLCCIIIYVYVSNIDNIQPLFQKQKKKTSVVSTNKRLILRILSILHSYAVLFLLTLNKSKFCSDVSSCPIIYTYIDRHCQRILNNFFNNCS